MKICFIPPYGTIPLITPAKMETTGTGKTFLLFPTEKGGLKAAGSGPIPWLQQVFL
jgi:hypothetical protein